MSIDKKAVCYALNDYIFRNIWNAPTSEFRVNVKPFLVNNSRSNTGHCLINNKLLPLPNSSEAFFVYRFSHQNVHGVLDLEKNTWYNTVDLCNDYNILIHTYTGNGLTLSKKNCYIYVEKSNNAINLAVAKRILNRVSPTDKEVYITTYLDSDYVGNVTVYSYDGGNTTPITYRLNRATAQSTLYEDRHMIYIDGYYYSPSVARALFDSNKLVDVIIDEDILGTFDVPVMSDPHTFYSDKDDLYKEIVHIPKSINPDNHIITFNTCSMFVQDDTKRGTYLHYTADKTVCQLTHNDLSVPTYVVDAHKDYLSVSTVTLHVKVRKHSKGNRLLHNSNYIDLLYITQNDDQIIDHLDGTIDSTLSFWKASVLENHPYVNMMFSVPTIVEESNMDLYIEALGYYQVVSLLSNRIITTKITDLTTNILSYPKPYIWNNKEIYPVVYRNGYKIKEIYVKYLNTPNRVSIRLTGGISLAIDDEITVYMFPKGDSRVTHFIPSTEQASVVLNNEEFSSYIKIIHDLDIHGLYKDTTVAYEELIWSEYDGLIFIVDNGDGTSTYTFDTTLYGTAFVFMYDTYTKTFTKDLTDDIDETKNFVVDLYHHLVEEDIKIPLLNVKDTCVYFNGQYLVEGVDYTYVPVEAHDGSIAMTQVCVQNISYAKDVGTNIIEIVASTIETMDSDSGFVLNDIASEDIDVDLWFKGLSTLHVNGLYESDVICTGMGMVLPDNKYSDGRIFELKTAIPVVVQELLQPYDGTQDITYIETIETYLNAHLVATNPDVVLEESHRIMSSYTNFLINGILNDEISISYDPDISRIQSQLSSFDYLKQFDNVFNTDPINLRFVDIYPTYRDLTVVSPSKAQVIYMLTDLVLPEDPYTSGVVPNEPT